MSSSEPRSEAEGKEQLQASEEQKEEVVAVDYDNGSTAAAPPVTTASPSSPNHPLKETGRPDSKRRDVIAIVNPLSGERSAANAVIAGLKAALPPTNVISLNSALFADPTPIVDKIKELRLFCASNDFDVERRATPAGVPTSPLGRPFRRPTVLVAGGDGTVSFIFSVVASLDETLDEHRAKKQAEESKQAASSGSPASSPTMMQSEEDLQMDQLLSTPTPAIGTLALGTGNDFSATLGFGQGYTRYKFCPGCICLPNAVEDTISRVYNAGVTPFDRWVVKIEAVEPYSGRRTPVDQVFFTNYFSVGMDAHVSSEFDRRRKQFPSMFRYRLMNKAWYGLCGVQGWWRSGKLQDAAQLFVNGKELQIAKDSMAIVVSNVTSYAGGAKLWKGADAKRNETDVSIGDGKLEITTLNGFFHMGSLQVGGTGCHVGQGGSVEIVLQRRQSKKGAELGTVPLRIPMQIDGEPLGAYDAVPDDCELHATIHQSATPSYVRCGNLKRLKK